MAAFSVRQMRQIEPPPVVRKPEERRDELENLRRLAAEPMAPAISRVVIAGIVRAVETALITITGLAPTSSTSCATSARSPAISR